MVELKVDGPGAYKLKSSSPLSPLRRCIDVATELCFLYETVIEGQGTYGRNYKIVELEYIERFEQGRKLRGQDLVVFDDVLGVLLVRCDVRACMLMGVAGAIQLLG